MVLKQTIIERDDLDHPFFYAKVLEESEKNRRKVARENSSTSNNNNRADLYASQYEGLNGNFTKEVHADFENNLAFGSHSGCSLLWSAGPESG